MENDPVIELHICEIVNIVETLSKLDGMACQMREAGADKWLTTLREAIRSIESACGGERKLNKIYSDFLEEACHTPFAKRHKEEMDNLKEAYKKWDGSR